MNDGTDTVYKTVEVEKNTTATEPEDPARKDYNFTKWYTDKNTTEEYDFDTKVTEDLDLYAGWEDATAYLVTFYMNDDTVTIHAVKEVKSGDKVAMPIDPTRDGYTFTGWYLDKEGTTKYNFSDEVIKDLDLYAGWYKPQTDSKEDEEIDKNVQTGDILIYCVLTIGLISLGTAVILKKKKLM